MKQLTERIVIIGTVIWLIVSCIVQIDGWPVIWGLLPGEIITARWVIPGTLFSILLLGTGLFAEKSWVSKHYELHLPGSKKIYAGLAFLILLAIAWTLRSQNHFMGDGWLFIDLVKGDFFLRKHEPLDFFIHQLISRGLVAIELNRHRFLILYRTFCYFLFLFILCGKFPE